MQIRLANMDDIYELVEHDLRHMREPGFDGQPAHPFPADFPWNKEKRLEEKLVSLPRTLSEARWQRSFIVNDKNTIVAHLNLKNLFEGSMHRAQLGMGIETAYRHQGLGKSLMKSALMWAQEQGELDWVDLTVFSHNTPAKKLYASFDFLELYTHVDKIRVNGQSIDDISMSLKLIR